MKALTRKQILEALKIDDSGMFGWIGEFPGTKTTNHNLGHGYVTYNMLSKLEDEGIISYQSGDEIWAMQSEYDKCC